ncbi:MAG: NAD(P)H-dependent glycerol-3-phosphate dehydrogenase [Actinomycetota bacterium]
MRIAVLGAGAMGTALALTFERAGNDVTICGTEFDEALIGSMRADRLIPDSIGLVSWGNWGTALPSADIVALAVSSSGVREIVRHASSMLSDEAVWAVATKGWEPGSAQPLSSVLKEVAPLHKVVILVGPSLASELAAGTPTGLVAASSDLAAAQMVGRAVDCSTVGVYLSTDVAGVEVGAALKNVLAIAIAMCDGIMEARGKPMTNTKAALFSRGLVEMARLAEAMGGRRETVLGLAGAGDLFVTVLGGRNGRFGRLIGAGLDPEKAFAEMGTTVEGYDNARQAVQLADRYGVDLPVVRMVYSVLYEGVSPEGAIEKLVMAEVADEI